MAKSSRTSLTGRDLEILTSLDRTPLTAGQLVKVSVSFEQPFFNEQLARRRLRRLQDAGFVASFPYSLVSDGRAPRYWKLTRNGFRVIYGDGTPLPGRRFFSEIASAKHVHTNAIAEFVVHLVSTAKRNNVYVRGFARENSVRITANNMNVYPDAAFQLIRENVPNRPYCFILELDTGSERVRTKQDIESLERKVQVYAAHQSKFRRDDPNRYIGLFITLRSQTRASNFLNLCQEITGNTQRTHFVATSLNDFCESDAFKFPILKTNAGLKRTILPAS